MRHVVVRFGEIGSKSPQVRGKMLNVLRQRVEDRLKYDCIDFEKVSRIPARITVETEVPEKASKAVAELPGVSSASPAYRTEPEVEDIKDAVEKLEIGNSFGVDTNRSGSHSVNSMELNREIGGFIEKITGAEVDLDNPDTWVKIDLREDSAFIYTQEFEGPGGFPVGTQDDLLALVSGGIDSPVAAYKVMKRGAEILPVYFYNKPIAAEDHLLRFKSVLEKLERFHPSRQWSYYVVDMEEINRKLMKHDKGRMVMHRRIMFKVSEKIAEKEGLKGMVTGESMGQKSSQTAHNLGKTSETVDLPIHRPLLTESKHQITDEARKLGTLERSNIKSACRTLAPDNPATELKDDEINYLENAVDTDKMVREAVQNVEKKIL